MRPSKLAMRVAVAALLTALVTACRPGEAGRASTPDSKPTGADNQPLAAADAQAARQVAAEFRLAARRMYESLFDPSCEAPFESPSGFSRERLLDKERREVSDFEQSLNGKPGSEHLSVARADAALGRGCWMDSDLEFALKHVEMTKETTRHSLVQLRELAPKLDYLNLAAGSATAGGEFRLGVGRLISAVEVPCLLVAGVSNDDVLAPARERMEQFERGLSGSAFATQYDIAKDDFEFERSVTVLDCFPPGKGGPEDISQASLQQVEQIVAELEALIKR